MAPLSSGTKRFIKVSVLNNLSCFKMDCQTESRNKKGDKAKRNKGFPYKRLRIREEEKNNERITKQ